MPRQIGSKHYKLICTKTHIVSCVYMNKKCIDINEVLMFVYIHETGRKNGGGSPFSRLLFFQVFYLKTLIHVWNINKQVDLKNTI